jgi:hypothetical protein
MLREVIPIDTDGCVSHEAGLVSKLNTLDIPLRWPTWTSKPEGFPEPPPHPFRKFSPPK